MKRVPLFAALALIVGFFAAIAPAGMSAASAGNAVRAASGGRPAVTSVSRLAAGSGTKVAVT